MWTAIVSWIGPHLVQLLAPVLGAIGVALALWGAKRSGKKEQAATDTIVTQAAVIKGHELRDTVDQEVAQSAPGNESSNTTAADNIVPSNGDSLRDKWSRD